MADQTYNYGHNLWNNIVLGVWTGDDGCKDMCNVRRNKMDKKKTKRQSLSEKIEGKFGKHWCIILCGTVSFLVFAAVMLFIGGMVTLRMLN